MVRVVQGLVIGSALAAAALGFAAQASAEGLEGDQNTLAGPLVKNGSETVLVQLNRV